MIATHYPEMQGETTAHIQARFTGLTSKPYTVVSKKPIPASRGIVYDGPVCPIGANNCPNRLAGWHKYHMTTKAFEAFEKANFVTLICLL